MILLWGQIGILITSSLLLQELVHMLFSEQFESIGKTWSDRPNAGRGSHR